MPGALAARASLVALLVLFVTAHPVGADSPLECADVFTQTQQQGGTEVTPVATGSQFGVVVMVAGAEGVGLFASGQVRPVDCASDGPHHPPQGSVEPPEVSDPVTDLLPVRTELPAEARAALDQVSDLLLP